MPEANTQNSPFTFPNIASLIEDAKNNPPEPIVSGLLNEGEVAGLHGPPEAFKTIFTLQIAEAIASGKPFLGRWDVPKPRSVYYLETEMSTTAMGSRLGKMYPHKPPAGRIAFADEKRLRAFKRAHNLLAKFQLLEEWIKEAESEVVILDTCNPFFRGKETPNDETSAGQFFDLLGDLPTALKMFVRHNHKPRIEDASADGAYRIRGSGQFADVPDVLIEISRTDKRINKAELAVTKYRHGTKPDDLKLWFDSGDFRLCSENPVIHLLKEGSLTRSEILDDLQRRFGVAQRRGDDLIDQQRTLGYLLESMEGHERVYELNLGHPIIAARFKQADGSQIA